MNTPARGKKFPESDTYSVTANALDQKSGKKKAKLLSRHWPFGHSA
jgi:hypothetical protein